MEWLSSNWEWVLLVFMVLEKIVKMSPSDKDDSLLDVVVQGLTKMVKGKEKRVCYLQILKDKLKSMAQKSLLLKF